MTTCRRRSIPSCALGRCGWCRNINRITRRETAVAQAVAKQLGLGRETVRRWIVQADIDAGERPGVTSAEHAEIKAVEG